MTYRIYKEKEHVANNDIELNNLTNSLKKRFVKDFSLPISIFKDDIFKYYINELDNYFQTKNKLKLFNNWINTLSKEEKENIKNYLFNKLQNAIDKFKQTEIFKFFNSIDMKNFNINNINIKQENIYIPDNNEKIFLSIDLKKANLQAILIYNLIVKTEKYIGKYRNVEKEYEEFIKEYIRPRNNIEFEYFKQSKYIRQYLFGNLNPKRQQKLQKYFINLIANKILTHTNEEIVSASSDEIVIKNPKDLNKIENIINEVKFNHHLDLNITKFKLKQIDKKYSFYYKEHENGFKEIKNVPTPLWMQVYKKIYNLPLHEYDLKIIYNENNLKLIATLDKPLFS